MTVHKYCATIRVYNSKISYAAAFIHSKMMNALKICELLTHTHTHKQACTQYGVLTHTGTEKHNWCCSFKSVASEWHSYKESLWAYYPFLAFNCLQSDAESWVIDKTLRNIL